MEPTTEPVDYSKPVAYDTNGNPLYAHPPEITQQPVAEESQVVHMTRPFDPVPATMSPEVQSLHDASVKRYPDLNLSEGEYVINAVQRHPFGLVPIFIGMSGGIIVLVILVGLYSNLVKNSVAPGSLPPVAAVSLVAILIGMLFVIGGFMAVYIYTSNRFYLTNESVVQEIRTGLFSKHEQTVSLINIEDASYQQNGIIPTLLNYGSIRLSTEGDETTYRFSYVSNPKKHIATLNNAVEAFKNGRPVVSDQDNL